MVDNKLYGTGRRKNPLPEYIFYPEQVKLL